MTRRAIGVSERPPLLQTIPLSLQHLFAMFGATVLVPVLFHINPATVLLFNGIGTLLYLFICKGKIPAYLGSSFAFLGGFGIVAPKLMDAAGQQTIPNAEMLPYACAGVAFSGILYLLFSALISVDRFTDFSFRSSCKYIENSGGGLSAIMFMSSRFVRRIRASISSVFI